MLLSDNEKAFAQKLKRLENENDAVSQKLQAAHNEYVFAVLPRPFL